jgi:hypothetical protein
MALAHRERPELLVADVWAIDSTHIARDVTRVRLRLGGELVDVMVRAEQSAPQWMTCQAAAPSRAIGHQALSLRPASDNAAGSKNAGPRKAGQ